MTDIKHTLATIAILLVAAMTTGQAHAASQPSVLWRNMTTGAWSAWNLSGTTVVSTTTLSANLADPNGSLQVMPPLPNTLNSGPIILNADNTMTAWEVSSNGSVSTHTVPSMTWSFSNYPFGQLDFWGSNWIVTEAISYGNLSAGMFNLPLTTYSGTEPVGATVGLSDMLYMADFDNNGFGDIVMFDHYGSGTLTIDYLGQPFEGGSYVERSQNVGWSCGSGCAIGNGGPWGLIAAGDINGDGYADLLWWNPTSGVVSYWQLNGNGGVEGAYSLNWTCGPSCWGNHQWTPVGLISL
jgi:hypothetical protein